MSSKRPASHAGIINSSNVGYKLLKKAGWQEGTGLGANSQGPQEPLQLPLQKGNTGLGFSSQEAAKQPSAKQCKAGEQTAAEAAVGTAAAQAAGLGGPGQRIGPKLPKTDVSKIVEQELAIETSGQKVALHSARMRAERKAARDRLVQAQLYRAFNEPGDTQTADVNPLLRQHNPLSATNPLLD